MSTLTLERLNYPAIGRCAIAALLLVFTCAIAQEIGFSKELLEYVRDKYGFFAKRRVENWQNLIIEKRNLPELKKLEIVNDFFNEVEFVDDIDHWGVEDYWATPVEMLATNGGDCEDYSIAKYFTLKEMGVPSEKMLITYVKAYDFYACSWCSSSQAHMVLTYYATPNAEPLILDNLIDKIKTASARDDLKPVYSFNGDGLWLAQEHAKGKRVGPADRISLWKDLGIRMKREIGK